MAGRRASRYWIPAYKWTDGTRFSYMNWSLSKSEPNCRASVGCCALNMDRGGDWWDLGCHQLGLFVCKMYISRPFELFQPDNYLMRLEQRLDEKMEHLKSEFEAFSFSRSMRGSLLIFVVSLLSILVSNGLFKGWSNLVGLPRRDQTTNVLSFLSYLQKLKIKTYCLKV